MKNYTLKCLKSSDGYGVYSVASGDFVDYVHKDLEKHGPGPVIQRWITYDDQGRPSRRYVGKLGDFATRIVARFDAAKEAK